jgi:hypothetical protein
VHHFEFSQPEHTHMVNSVGVGTLPFPIGLIRQLAYKLFRSQQLTLAQESTARPMQSNRKSLSIFSAIGQVYDWELHNCIEAADRIWLKLLITHPLALYQAAIQGLCWLDANHRGMPLPQW